MGQVLFCTPKGRLGPWRWGWECQVRVWGRAVGGMCSDVPYSDSPELLGSTKRLNINYQDADGYVLLGTECGPGEG